MKKVILSLAIFAATSLSIMAATDNKTNDTNSKAKTECCKEGKGDCKKADGRKGCKGKMDGRKADCDKGDRGMRAFEGLNLTETQKTKLEELRKKNEEMRREMRTKMDKEMKEAGKEKRDFKDMSAEEKKKYQEEKQKLKAEMKAKRAEEKKKFLNDIKSILTPEQYTKFLENYYNMSGAKHSKGRKNDDKKKNGMHAKKGNTVTKTVTA